MNISESAVETLLYRARLRFKEEFVALEGAGELECGEVTPLLAPYVAGKLRRSQAESVRRHLAGCVRCTRKLGAPMPPPGLAEVKRRRRRTGT
jgi:hypothetical protein